MAVVLRFFVGLANGRFKHTVTPPLTHTHTHTHTSGMVGTVKAVISEVSDDTNQAFGMSLVSSAMGLGFIIGPAVSGAIADPIGQYNLTIHSERCTCMIVATPTNLSSLQMKRSTISCPPFPTLFLALSTSCCVL